MQGDQAERALARIEAALFRIETASSRIPAADDDLAMRHQQLRSAVGETLRELDELIAGQPR